MYAKSGINFARGLVYTCRSVPKNFVEDCSHKVQRATRVFGLRLWLLLLLRDFSVSDSKPIRFTDCKAPRETGPLVN